MALKLDERYPGRADPASVDYPQGSFKNRTSPTAKDGTYLEKDWANDQQGFLQSLLKAVDVVANGSVDKVGASQYFDALKQIIQDESPAPDQATETVAGIAKVATQAVANELTSDADFITPKKLPGATKAVLSASGSAPVFACRAWVNFNGIGTIATRGSGNIVSITDHAVGVFSANYATPMSNANYAALVCAGYGAAANYALRTANIIEMSASFVKFNVASANTVNEDVVYNNLAIFG